MSFPIMFVSLRCQAVTIDNEALRHDLQVGRAGSGC